MAESPSSAVPALPGLVVTTVEWLASGAESGLVRVRGRWEEGAAAEPDLPQLALRAGGADHRFESLPDARFTRDPSSWRGTYLVPAELVVTDPEALWLEWAGGARAGLPPLRRGVEPPPVPAAPERPEEPDQPGGQVIDRAVLAERRARRAEAAEQAQAKVAAEALKAVEVLELRSAELERRLEEATVESVDAATQREALAEALASAAALRSRSREWQLRLRTNEVRTAGDAVRLAVLEAERVEEAPAMREALASRSRELDSALREAAERATEAREALAAIEARADAAESALGQAETRARVEALARATLEDELDRERTARAAALRDHVPLREELATERALTADLRRELGLAGDLRSELEAERAARRAAEEALAAAHAELAAERAARGEAEAALAATGESLQERITELERRAATAPTAEAVASLAAAPAQPSPESTRLVADLDAAAEALRRRVAPPSAEEPPAPDAEPWSDRDDEAEREPCVPAVEPVREVSAPDEAIPWAPPGFGPEAPGDGEEPPAPDAEPGVEWAPPAEPPPSQWVPPGTAPPPVALVEPIAPAPVALADPPAPLAEPAAPPEPAARPSGPVIVPAARPPARALATGTGSRDYPLLRGAIVKLAHDDPDTAARLLAALLPAQGAVIDGPLAYDLTIEEAGSFGVDVAGGRATVNPIEHPRPRGIAEFHLMGDALLLAELLAGVDRRIGRFFGPVRARGRKRRLKELKALSTSSLALADAARAGAQLDPELVYRLFAYAVHPTWTKGHDFTVAQEITGDAPATWYLAAADGRGVSVGTTAPAETAATVSMSRATFDRLLRQEPVPPGQRPCVRGDREAVALMREWTARAQGA